MTGIVAIYGSPRRRGNTAMLLAEAVRGAAEAGAAVEKIVLRDLKLSPCLEIYGCRKDGRCVIRDDFHAVLASVDRSAAVMLATPIFFYTVSAHTKIFMDRCQSRWVGKYLIDPPAPPRPATLRKGLFIAAGATSGPRLFDGPLLTVRYFFDALDTELWRSLCYRRLDREGDVMQHPEYLDQARRAGRDLATILARS